MNTSPWVWIAVGFATAHLFWTVLFVAWWTWIGRGDRAKLEKAQRDFQTTRRAIRDQQHTW